MTASLVSPGMQDQFPVQGSTRDTREARPSRGSQDMQEQMCLVTLLRDINESQEKNGCSRLPRYARTDVFGHSVQGFQRESRAERLRVRVGLYSRGTDGVTSFLGRFP